MFSRLRTTFGGTDGMVSSATSNSKPLNLTAGVPQTVPGNTARGGIQTCPDSGGTGVVYLLCGSTAQRGVVSATNFDFSFAPGGQWRGLISEELWTGPVQLISTATITVGVIEV